MDRSDDFDGLYLVLVGVVAVLTLGVVVLVRRWMWRRSGAPVEIDPSGVHPCDVALLVELAGSWRVASLFRYPTQRAALVGLVNLERRCVVTWESSLWAGLWGTPFVLEDAANHAWWVSQAPHAAAATTVQARTYLPSDAHPIERSVYEAVTRNGAVRPDGVIRVVSTKGALGPARNLLAARHWLADNRTTRGLQLSALLWLPLLLLGLGELFGVLGRGLDYSENPDAWIAPAIVAAVAVVAMVVTARPVLVAPACRRLIRTIRVMDDHRRNLAFGLSQPPRGRAGPEVMALAVAGPTELWSVHPALAASLGVAVPSRPSDDSSCGCGCG